MTPPARAQTIVVAPDRREQALRSLADANTVRLERARLHREIAALPQADGLRRVADLIVDNPRCIGTARVSDVMRWAKRYGHQRAGRLLNEHRISHVREVRGLTDRQRRLLASELRHDADTAERREQSRRAA